MLTAPALIRSEINLLLEAKIRGMTELMTRGDKLGVARFYADNALITDMKEIWVNRRDAIDQYWTNMPVFTEWQLRILETGGDAEAPFQRLSSVAWLEIEGVQHVDMGHSLMVWKKQADGDYRVSMDMYRLLSFHSPGSAGVYPWG